MRRVSIERKLTEGSRRLATAREELEVGEEQLRQLAEEAEEARLRALVSDGPADEKVAKEAERHASALERHLSAVRAEIARTEAEQDRLLDELGNS
ncbi:MAG: hypothetical protein AAGK32_08095 [Actinomycetota bacterium]